MRKSLGLPLGSFFVSVLAVALCPGQVSHGSTGVVAAPAPRLSSAAFTAMETINPERIRAHVRFLSHDLLEGRGTGQRGGDLDATAARPVGSA